MPVRAGTTLCEHMVPGTHAATLRFPREYRLTKPAEFEKVLRRPEIRVRSGALRIAAVQNRMLTARLGLIVGKKAIPHAHARNRVKRIIREYFRRARAELPEMDIVVRVVAQAPDRELRTALDAAFAKLEKRAVEHSPAS